MRFYRALKVFYSLPVGLFSVLLVASVLYLVTNKKNTPNNVEASNPQVVRGVARDLWADIEIGKRDFGEISPREVVGYKVSSPGGIIVDRSVSPGRMYVWDSGNSRIVGIDLGACYSSNSPCTASIVIGQPGANDYGACNQDASFSLYPDRKPASNQTLCGIPESTQTTLEDKSFTSMFVDSEGSLYVGDVHNHRVLKYNSPFTTDTIADDVWGQTDFAGNMCNRGSLANASSLCFSDKQTGANGAGVTFDANGNLWIADGGNNRVLSFSKNQNGAISKTADLVLGQGSLTNTGSGSGMNQMNAPRSVTFDTNGKLYVADSGNARIITYNPPFSNGMSANSTFGNGYPQDTHLTSENDPWNRGIWVFDASGNNGRVRLWDYDGIIIKNEFLVNDFGSGSLGFDTDQNVLASSYRNTQNVLRYTFQESGLSRDSCAQYDNNITACDAADSCAWYSCSNRCWLNGTPLEIGCSSQSSGSGYIVTKNLFSPPSGYNLSTARRLEHPAWVGVAILGDQLVVSDGRLQFWNGVSALSNGIAPTGYLGSPNAVTIPDPGYTQIKSDGSLRLWTAKRDKIEVYQGPLTTGTLPIATLTSPMTTVNGGQFPFSEIYGLVPTQDAHFLWLSEPSKSRVFRVKDPLTNPRVDIVLGQQMLTGGACNRGNISAPNTYPNRPANQDADRSMLCFPGALSIDKLGNLYVSDHSLEAEGNWRLLMFSSSLFPANLSQVLFAPSATKEFPRQTAGNSYSHATFEPAFDQYNRMFVGYNPYLGSRFPEYYNDPTLVNPSNPSDPQFAKPDGHLNDFYGWAVAATFDSNNNLYMYDANRGQVRIYKDPLAPPSTPTPTLAITPTPATITLVSIADSYVNSDSPSKNYGTSNDLETVKGTPNKISYLKFNLSTLAGKTIVSAQLKLYITNNSSQVNTVKEVVDTSWNEKVITYTTRPTAGTSLTTFTPSSANTFKVVDLTSYISSKVGSTVSFAIEGSGTNNAIFASKEASNSSRRPVLVIQYY